MAAEKSFKSENGSSTVNDSKSLHTPKKRLLTTLQKKAKQGKKNGTREPGPCQWKVTTL